MTATPEWRRAARVVRRLQFGATGAEIDSALANPDAWLNTALAPKTLDQVKAGDNGVRITPAPVLPTRALPAATASDAVQAGYDNTVKAEMNTATTWWLRRMAAANEPVRERITFGWHGIFATNYDKVRSARLMVVQNETIRANALGSFRTLANAMLADPAMLRWLDGSNSTEAAPNENLSREFMELFALGHDAGYTETDVREGARALTGWVVDSRENAVYNASQHDAGSKTLLGVTGNLDTPGFCEAVVTNPASARYIANKWWKILAAPTDAPASLLDRIVAAYGPNMDISAMIREIVLSWEFFQAEGTIIQSPVEWYFGAMRALKVPYGLGDIEAMNKLTALGQVPFAPPSVGGWPAGKAWLTSATARTRYDAALRLANAANITALLQAPKEKKVDTLAYMLGLPGFSDRTTAALTPLINNPRVMVQNALISPDFMVI